MEFRPLALYSSCKKRIVGPDFNLRSTWKLPDIIKFGAYSKIAKSGPKC